MNTELILRTKREIKISKTALLYFNMLAKRCGIDLSDYEEQAIYNRLIKRVHFLKLPNFDVYCNRLRVDLDEEVKFINFITNNTTYFFRENHHFEFLANKSIPELMVKQDKIRIWSAGCSTGEEAYSIAIVIQETISPGQFDDIKILATDINSDALTQAQEGIYTSDQLKKVSSIRLNTWFDKIDTEQGTFFAVKDKVKQLITFNQLNLISAWPMHQSFDIIFCRNVIIYFNPEISQNILERFHQFLNPKGLLILGYSENLNAQRKKFTSIGKTVYRKIS